MVKAYTKLIILVLICNCFSQIFSASPATAQQTPTDKTEENNSADEETNNIYLPPELIRDSPILQEWLREVPVGLISLK